MGCEIAGARADASCYSLEPSERASESWAHGTWLARRVGQGTHALRNLEIIVSHDGNAEPWHFHVSMSTGGHKLCTLPTYSVHTHTYSYRYSYRYADKQAPGRPGAQRGWEGNWAAWHTRGKDRPDNPGNWQKQLGLWSKKKGC